ncbi:MAG: sigma factor [Nakamurella sp.]
MVRRVLSSCRRLLTDRTEAEDVAQDVFLEVWMKAANFDAAGGSATAWILGIAHHRAVDRIRTSGGARRRNVSHHHHHHHHHRPSPADAA